MGLRASETYKASVEQSTYTHCLSKKDLLNLMITFPDSQNIFMRRAQARRIEFRRIKKQYEKFAQVDKMLELEDKEKLDAQHGFVIQHYDEKSDAPPFLAEYDYYFEKQGLVDIRDEELEEISDSEQQAR